MEKETLFTTSQAAKYLNVSHSFLAKARVNGAPEIPFTRIGMAVRYRKSDLDAHIAANLRTSTSAANAA